MKTSTLEQTMNPDHIYPGYSVLAATSMAFAWHDQQAHTAGNNTQVTEISLCLWAEQEPQPEAR
jgi:hypothetical protein